MGGPTENPKDQASQGDLPPNVTPFDIDRRQRDVLIRVVRATFFVLFLTVTLLYILSEGPGSAATTLNWWVTLLVASGAAAVVLVIDVLTPRKKISTLFSIALGLLGAMLASLAIGFIIDLVIESWIADDTAINAIKPLVNLVKVLLGVSLCYLSVVTVLQTQDDFRLVIPYVEFAKQIRGPRPLVLDTSALIDARIADVASTSFLQAPMIVPRVVISELQTLADSADSLKRAKGRRGLDVISRLQRLSTASLSVDDTVFPNTSTDQAIVELSRSISGMIVTTDLALARVAAIQGVLVLNLNDLGNALKPNALPGEELVVKLLRAGEQAGQAVGFLPDGTMIVAENAREAIGQTVPLEVVSSLQTSAGRLIFARLRGGDSSPIATDQSPGDESEAFTRDVDVAEGVVDHGASVGEVSSDIEVEGSVEDHIEPHDGSAPDTRTARSPHPPKPPRSLRAGTPRNPRR